MPNIFYIERSPVVELLGNIKLLAEKLKNAGDLGKIWVGPHLYVRKY